MNERITVTMTDGVADVRLVRADKMNALDSAMFEALVATTAKLHDQKGLRAVVLSGEGRAFCAGLDMGRFANMKEGDTGGTAQRDLLARTYGQANAAQQAVWGWRLLPVPVIAAVHGVALGGGFQLALGADMRFVAPDTRMSIMEIKWGLVPDMAGTRSCRNWCATMCCATSPIPAASSRRRKRSLTVLRPASATIPMRPRWKPPARSPPRTRTPSAPTSA